MTTNEDVWFPPTQNKSELARWTASGVNNPIGLLRRFFNHIDRGITVENILAVVPERERRLGRTVGYSNANTASGAPPPWLWFGPRRGRR